MDAMHSHNESNTTTEPLRTLRLLLARLERISADSVTAELMREYDRREKTLADLKACLGR